MKSLTTGQFRKCPNWSSFSHSGVVETLTIVPEDEHEIVCFARRSQHTHGPSVQGIHLAKAGLPDGLAKFELGKEHHMTNLAYPLLLCLIIAPNIAGEHSSSNSICVLPGESRLALSRAGETNDEDVVIRDAWVQEGPPSQKITAAFMVIENHTGADISLQSASSDVAQSVELHKMELVDGMMKMHRVETIDIPAGGQAELKPGGYHLMVIGLKKELKQGDKVTLALQFSGDIKKTITVPVKPRSAMEKEN